MLLDDARETIRSDSIDRRKTILATRTSRLSPIGLISVLYVLCLYAFYRQGFIGLTAFVGIASFVLFVVALFYVVFRLGLNMQFADASLMLPQLLVTLLILLAVAKVAPATQIALVPFILIAFSFGIFRLSTALLILLSVACLAAYLGIIMMRVNAGSYDYSFRADLVRWFVLALTLPGMIIVGKQIQNLKHLLNATRYQLEHFEEKSIRDELTGLYNRRHIQSELEQAKLHADTRSVPFSICLIDIDRFKTINDNHGHLIGDTILREFARVALDSIRDTDTLGRYGGDEFIQILRDTEVKGAVMHAERLRVYAHFLDFQKVLAQKHISLSIGVAQYRNGEKITDLISRADSALYQAKQLGRNRVEWAGAA